MKSRVKPTLKVLGSVLVFLVSMYALLLALIWDIGSPNEAYMIYYVFLLLSKISAIGVGISGIMFGVIIIYDSITNFNNVLSHNDYWKDTKRLWNKGICPFNGKPWEHFTTTSYGSRGYQSDQYFCWLDRKFYESEVDREVT